MSGYTLSYRDKWSNPVFRNLLEAGIWSWMCDTAAWASTRVRHNGVLVELKRGQLVTTVSFISEGFGIGHQVTRTFLENLEKDGMINKQANKWGTVITICNYDKYQVDEKSANKQGNKQLTNSQQTANNNKNTLNTSNKERGARGTRLPENWKLPQEWGQWAVDEFNASPEQVRAVADTFKDYWTSATKNATKLDWFATWRNWCRREKFEKKGKGRGRITL